MIAVPHAAVIDRSGLLNQAAVSAVAHMVAGMVGLLEDMVETGCSALTTGKTATGTITGGSRSHLNRTSFGRRTQWFLAHLPSLRTGCPWCPFSQGIACIIASLPLWGDICGRWYRSFESFVIAIVMARWMLDLVPVTRSRSDFTAAAKAAEYKTQQFSLAVPCIAPTFMDQHQQK